MLTRKIVLAVLPFLLLALVGLGLWSVNSVSEFYLFGAVLFCCVALGLGLLRPDLMMLLFIVSPMLPDVARPIFTTAVVNNVSLAFALLVVSFGIRIVLKGRWLLRFPKPTRTTLILYAVVLFAGAFRVATAGGGIAAQTLVTEFARPLIIICTMIVAYNFVRYFTVKRLFFVFLAVIVSILISFAIDRILFGISAKDHGGYFGTGNTTGNVLIAALPMLFVPRLAGIKNQLYWCVPWVAVVAIVLSRSRGSAVALSVMVLAYVVFVAKLPSRTKAVVALGVALVTYAFVPFQELFAGVADIDQERANQISSGRIAVWRLAIDYLSDATILFFGGGPNGFLEEFPLSPNTQNHLLRIWVDFGLVGVTIVCAFYLRLTVLAWAARKSENAELRVLGVVMLFTLLGVQTIGIFSHFHLGSHILVPFWLVTGWFLAVRQEHASAPAPKPVVRPFRILSMT